MDISYMLYYVMMDDLRERFKKRFPKTLFGAGYYLYSELTHIYDVERLDGLIIPENLIGEIEITFAIHSFLQEKRVERCQIYSSSAFVLESNDVELREVLEQWMMAVKIRYFMKKLTNGEL
jgi:hypothetical protein